MAAKFRPRARNDDEDHRHEAKLPLFLVSFAKIPHGHISLDVTLLR